MPLDIPTIARTVIYHFPARYQHSPHLKLITRIGGLTEIARMTVPRSLVPW
jgi:hypothetical protein